MNKYSVVGYYADTEQPFIFHTEANTPLEAAISIKEMTDAGAEDTLITNVFTGHHFDQLHEGTTVSLEYLQNRANTSLNGGDLYAGIASKHNTSREVAQAAVFPLLYGLNTAEGGVKNKLLRALGTGRKTKQSEERS